MAAVGDFGGYLLLIQPWYGPFTVWHISQNIFKVLSAEDAKTAHTYSKTLQLTCKRLQLTQIL